MWEHAARAPGPAGQPGSSPHTCIRIRGRQRQVRESHTHREDVEREPLTPPPKVERATAMGTIHSITPSNFSPKVCEINQEEKKDKNDPVQVMKYFSHHCYSNGGQQLLRAQSSDVRHVDKHVNEGYNRDGNGDRARGFPGRVKQICGASANI